MTKFVINEETLDTSIGELLRRAKTEEISLINAEGQPIGWIGPPPRALPPLTEEEREEARRRANADPSTFITLDELLARLNARVGQE